MTQESSDEQRSDKSFHESAHSPDVFRLLVSGVKDYAIFMLDPNGYIRTWNEGAERIKGYFAPEVLGKHFSIFYIEEDRERHEPENNLKIAKENGRYEEQGWRVRKDGSLFWADVVISAVFNHGELIGFAKVTRDLTERMLSERQRIRAEKQQEIFRLLVTSVKDYAIFMLDPQGNVLTWNEGARRLKGYQEEEIIGSHFSRFYTKDAVERAHPQHELEIARTQGQYEEEGWRVRKDGTLFWANVIITAVFEQGNLIGFAKVTRDLTERRLAEEQKDNNAHLLSETNDELRHALKVKSRLLSTISHEVRTPMSAIIGMTELLTFKDLGDDTNEIVQNIFHSSKRLLQLLNNMLESARMESGKLILEKANFPIRAMLGEVRQLVVPDANKKGLQLTGSCEAGIPEMFCGDELRVRQLLLNLAFNAVKFTESGLIDISCCIAREEDHIFMLRFTVTDTGIGIKLEDQLKLFQPFMQAEDATTRLYGGSGLGLSICKQLVDLMGGTVGFESEFGKGSTFWFEVPFERV